MQVAQARGVGERGEQWRRVAAIEEGRFAGGLEAIAQGASRARPTRCVVAEDFDDLRFDVRGDQLARRALGDEAAVVEPAAVSSGSESENDEEPPARRAVPLDETVLRRLGPSILMTQFFPVGWANSALK